jgi:hypothetical protein
MFFDKMPKIKLDLETPSISNKKYDILNTMVQNYTDSRVQFLDYSFKKDDVTYIVNAKRKGTSYQKEDNLYTFNLMNTYEDLPNLDEDTFLCDMVEEILNNSDSVVDCTYDVIYDTKCNSYCATNVIINTKGRNILIDVINADVLEHIINSVKEHNKKIEESYEMKLRRK